MKAKIHLLNVLYLNKTVKCDIWRSQRFTMSNMSFKRVKCSNLKQENACRADRVTHADCFMDFVTCMLHNVLIVHYITNLRACFSLF